MREVFTSLLPATQLLASFEKDDVLLVLRIWILLVDIALLFDSHGARKPVAERVD